MKPTGTKSLVDRTSHRLTAVALIIYTLPVLMYIEFSKGVQGEGDWGTYRGVQPCFGWMLDGGNWLSIEMSSEYIVYEMVFVIVVFCR